MIDARAIVSPQAQLAADVSVGAFSIIGPDVTIGARTVIGAAMTMAGIGILILG
jgi:UDP-N-acetylglucosamine acyltransferase